MNSDRFKQLRDLLGYDNNRLARMFNISATEVEEFCSGRKQVPESLAQQLEIFADWLSEVGDTQVKKELAKKHLRG